MQRKLSQKQQMKRAERNRQNAIASCDGKRRHTLRSSAEREALSLGRQYQAYPCRNCKGWHVGRR